MRDYRKVLQSLLDLANHPDTPYNEKQVALVKAQKVMLDHNLTEQDGEKKEFIFHKLTFLKSAGGEIWQRNLWLLLGNLNGVLVYKNMNQRNTTMLYGRENDVSITIEFFNHIANVIANEARMRQKENRTTTKHEFLKSFAYGAVVGYKQQTTELHQHPAYGIVLQKVASARNHMLEMGDFKLRRGKRQSIAINPEVRNNGHEFGKTIRRSIAAETLNRHLLG